VFCIGARRGAAAKAKAARVDHYRRRRRRHRHCPRPLTRRITSHSFPPAHTRTHTRTRSATRVYSSYSGPQNARDFWNPFRVSKSTFDSVDASDTHFESTTPPTTLCSRDPCQRTRARDAGLGVSGSPDRAKPHLIGVNYLNLSLSLSLCRVCALLRVDTCPSGSSLHTSDIRRSAMNTVTIAICFRPTAGSPVTSRPIILPKGASPVTL